MSTAFLVARQGVYLCDIDGELSSSLCFFSFIFDN